MKYNTTQRMLRGVIIAVSCRMKKIYLILGLICLIVAVFFLLQRPGFLKGVYEDDPLTSEPQNVHETDTRLSMRPHSRLRAKYPARLGFRFSSLNRIEDMSARVGGLSHFIVQDRIAKRDAELLKIILKQSKIEQPSQEFTIAAQLAQALVDWYIVDPEKALEFTLLLASPDEKNRLLNFVLTHVAETDFDRMLELAKLHLADEKGSTKISLDLFNKAALQDDLGEAILGLCSIGSADRRAKCPWLRFTYPEDFPFESTLNGLADIVAGLPEGRSLPIAPTLMLSTWAARDSDSAYQWLLQRKNVPYNSSFSNFMSGYRKHCTTLEAAHIAGQWVDPELEPDNAHRYYIATRILHEHTDDATLNAFLKGADDSGNTYTHLAGLLKATQGYAEGNIKRKRTEEHILAAMNPKERMRYYTTDWNSLNSPSASSNTASSRFLSYVPSYVEPLLRKLGHGDQDISRLRIKPPSVKTGAASAPAPEK